MLFSGGIGAHTVFNMFAMQNLDIGKRIKTWA